MPTYIVFLRAVNVRPRWVKMALLRELLSDNAFSDVETYIQSGNLRLQTPMRSAVKVRAELERLIEAEFGFQVPCVVRTPAALAEVAAYAEGLASPYPDGEARRYVTFCAEPVTADASDLLQDWEEPGERLRVHGSEVYWWLTKPAHQAKMTNARLEKTVGDATTRDIKVVRTLAERWGS
ncbi:DUF1697 domain-containing protein [Allobranchiibius sp. GilTou73]|uniref:DUF1697 domain-containing protein n=1 Tax=Allobranchiibius sp. GilTou73 TaxID=2904523 RepID=UPI001F1BA70E|nr:DUF1697 domain-containing protein [Allobranchiibius sp. GilTou73]UIJ34030.1 DUF1697 domain-containing protein [Allobranchiibius sp. GilTou73]